MRRNPPRFLVDVMLGTLARRLRLLGFDTWFLPDLGDGALIRKSNMTARYLLTADRDLASRPLARHAILLPPSGLDAQVAALGARLDLAPWAEPFARCAACNGLLRNAPRDRIRERVAPFVWESAEIFYSCTGCGRVYWQGSHLPGLSREIGRLLRILATQA